MFESQLPRGEGDAIQNPQASEVASSRRSTFPARSPTPPTRSSSRPTPRPIPSPSRWSGKVTAGSCSTPLSVSLSSPGPHCLPGGLIFCDQFIQIATTLPSDNMYGWGENIHQTIKVSACTGIKRASSARLQPLPDMGDAGPRRASQLGWNGHQESLRGSAILYDCGTRWKCPRSAHYQQ